MFQVQNIFLIGPIRKSKMILDMRMGPIKNIFWTCPKFRTGWKRSFHYYKNLFLPFFQKLWSFKKGIARSHRPDTFCIWYSLFLTVLLQWPPFDGFFKFIQFWLNLSARTQQFICKILIWIFRHPWNPWVCVNSKEKKYLCPKGQCAVYTLLARPFLFRIFDNVVMESHLIHNNI